MSAGVSSAPVPTQTSAPQRKVIAATGGAAVGSAVAIIITWILKGSLAKAGISLPDQIENAFNTLFTTMSAFAFGYYTSPSPNEVVAVKSDGKPVTATK